MHVCEDGDGVRSASSTYSRDGQGSRVTSTRAASSLQIAHLGLCRSTQQLP